MIGIFLIVLEIKERLLVKVSACYSFEREQSAASISTPDHYIIESQFTCCRLYTKTKPFLTQLRIFFYKVEKVKLVYMLEVTNQR